MIGGGDRLGRLPRGACGGVPDRVDLLGRGLDLGSGSRRYVDPLWPRLGQLRRGTSAAPFRVGFEPVSEALDVVGDGEVGFPKLGRPGPTELLSSKSRIQEEILL